jgi:hypothetical protein
MARTITQLRERLKPCNSSTETLLLVSTTFSLFWLVGSTAFHRTPPFGWLAFIIHNREVFASNLSKRQSAAVEVRAVFLILSLQLPG